MLNAVITNCELVTFLLKFSNLNNIDHFLILVARTLKKILKYPLPHGPMCQYYLLDHLLIEGEKERKVLSKRILHKTQA